MTSLLQILLILPLAGYIALIIVALRYVRKQNLPERQLILWDALIIFIPIGAFIPLLYFSRD